MKKTILVLSTLGIMLASCSGNKAKNNEAGSETGVYDYDHRGLVHDQKAIDKAFADLRNLDKYKGKKIKVFQGMQVQDYEIAIKIADPEKLTNIDKYTFTKGKWSAPEPVQLMGGGEDINDNLTDLDKIAVNKIADMVKIVDAKAKTIEGGKPCDYLGFNLFVPNQIREFSTTIDGTREKVSVTFTADGVLKSK